MMERSEIQIMHASICESFCEDGAYGIANNQFLVAYETFNQGVHFMTLVRISKTIVLELSFKTEVIPTRWRM